MGLDNIPEWWVFASSVLVMGLQVYWDVRSRPSRLRWARFTALFFIVSSMLALYAAPYQTIASKGIKALWVTDYSDQDVADSLENQGFQRINGVHDYNKLQLTNGIDYLMVVGDGLQQWELDHIGSIDEFISPVKLDEGVMDYSHGTAVAQTLLALKLRLNVNAEITIVVSGSGIKSVEEEVLPNSTKVNLEVLPTLAGYLTWQVDGVRNNDTIFSETIPVFVKEKQSANVLILANTPSFELRALKNHLAEAGFGIAERLKISSNLFHQAFTNIEERQLSTISNRVLANFQLIVVDALAYQSLGNAEQQRIKSKLEKGELGLLLMGEKGTVSLLSWKESKISMIKLTGEAGKISLEGSKWKLDGTLENVFYDNVLVAQSQSYGLGVIVRPLFSNSYSLKLQAENSLYARLWQMVLLDVFGIIKSDFVLRPPDFPRMNEPTELRFNAFEPAEVEIEGVRLAPKQVWFAPESWTVTYWPKDRGWKRLSIDGDSTVARFFTFDSTDWTLQNRMKKQTQTSAYLEQKSTTEANTKSTKTPISKWIFFGFFLAGMTFLWVEQRVQ